MATLYGTNSPDSIVGTSTFDHIQGWDSSQPYSEEGPADDADTIRGGGGPDWIEGGNGIDQVFGGSGNDTLDGGAMRGSLHGAEGDDHLHGSGQLSGGAGNDLLVDAYDGRNSHLSGGAGDDRVEISAGHSTNADGGDGIDVLSFAFEYNTAPFAFSLGDPASEQLLPDGTWLIGFERLAFHGGDQADTVTGGDLADTLDGGQGSDLLRGGGGDDSLISGGTAATLQGGSGNDTLEFWNGVGAVTLNGGDGDDLLVWSRWSLDEGMRLSIADPSTAEILPDGSLVIGIEQLEFSAGSGNDRLTGGSLGDTINGADGNNTIRGGAGNDVLRAWSGNQLVLGGAGDDQIRTDDGFDTLLGGGGNDVIELYEGTSGGILVGGKGNDLLIFHLDWDAISGSTLSFQDPALVKLTANGTEISGFEQVDLEGSRWTDRLTGGSANDTLNGAEGNDTLRGRDGADYLSGGYGHDLLIGGGGDDAFQVFGHARSEKSGDQIDGGAGFDLLIYETWDDQQGEAISLADPGVVQHLADGTRFHNIEALEFWGGDGDDTVIGGALADHLGSSGGNDFLDGAAGNDELSGYGSAATLLGGAGDDEIWADDLTGGLLDGGAGNDTLYFYVPFAESALVLDLSDPEAIIFLPGSTSATGFEALHLNGSEFDDSVTGGILADWIEGNSGDDLLQGGHGDDDLYGDGGRDSLHGGSGNDTLTGGWNFWSDDGRNRLFGGEGNDLLHGATGKDLLDGGAGFDGMYGYDGADTFRFSQTPLAQNLDWIGDFVSGEDRIALDGQAFGGLSAGALDPSSLAFGRHAADADDRLIWSRARGELCFDADGAGGVEAVLFLVLPPGTELVGSDFLIL